MGWIDRYRFTLTHPTEGARVVVPLLDDLVIRLEKDKEGVIFRKLVKTPLVLWNDIANAQLDFDWIDGINSGVNRCEKIDLLVEVSDGGSWQTLGEGYISLNDAKFNIRNCQAELAVRKKDDYSCLEEQGQTKVNVLSGATKYEVKGLVGYLEETVCGPSFFPNIDLYAPPLNDSCITAGEGWVAKRNLGLSLFPIGGGYYEGELRTTWTRERVDASPSSPPGSGWISIGGDSWVRSVPTAYNYEESQVQETPEGEAFLEQVWDVVSEYVFRNAMTLQDVLEKIVTEVGCTGLTIRSDFFRINEGSIPATAPYNAATAGFDQILVFQKSDVVTPNVSSGSTRLEVTWNDMMEMLVNTFNVAWKMEGTVIRIEHISYFQGVNGLDLTGADYLEYITNLNNFEYSSGDLPIRERWGWMDQVSGFFEGEDIIFGVACASEKVEVKEFRISQVTTDVHYIWERPNDISLEGMVFMAAYLDGSDYIYNIEDDYVNGHLAMTNLHDNYWKYDRPQPEGTMNGVSTNFVTSKKLKKQEALSVKIRPEVFVTIVPDNYFGTEMGWGELQEAEWHTRNGMLEISLNYDN